ncbi:MAG: O-antigen ligase family protein [candidate division Zixibacteria bacterium]|nr:O-antigen ligase family protein [candidate division Zixibacteria bacterium]
MLYLWIIGSGLQILCALMALYFGAGWALLPLAAGALAVTFLWPRSGVLLLIISWFYREPIFGIPGVFPADLFLIVLVIGYVAGQLATGGRIIEPTPLNRLILVWMAVYALSLINSVDYAMGIKSWLRHVQMFSLFVAVVGLADRPTIKRSIIVFLAACVVFSVPNIVTFLQARGLVRAFGAPHVLFSGFLALAAPITTGFYLFEQRASRRRLCAGLVFLFIAAQIANQSRGAMVQLISGVVFVTIFAYRWGRRHGKPVMRRRLAGFSMGLIAAATLALFVAGPEIQLVLQRYSSQSGNEAYTLTARRLLWASAVRVFLQHPFIGVGPAQTLSLLHYLPDVRFDPLEPKVAGLGIHNALLQYLAECGIIGSVALALLLGRALWLGRGIMESRDPDEAKWQVGIWGAVFVIVTRYLYEGHLFYSIAGMTTTAFMGMLYNIGRLPPESDRDRDHNT